MTIIKTLLHTVIYLSDVYIYMSAKENIKINENIAVNEPKKYN